MATDKRQFTLRVQEEVFEKVRFISLKEHRSIAMQIEYIVERYITDYEAKHGTIQIDEQLPR